MTTPTPQLRPKVRAHLALLRELLDEARGEQSWAACASLAKQISDLEGLQPPPQPKPKPPPEPTDHVEALRARLHATQSMRLQATERGSFDSASRLLRLEATLLGEVREAERARQATHPEIPDAELVELITADLQALPPPMRAAVLARLR